MPDVAMVSGLSIGEWPFSFHLQLVKQQSLKADSTVVGKEDDMLLSNNNWLVDLHYVKHVSMYYLTWWAHTTKVHLHFIAFL